MHYRPQKPSGQILRYQSQNATQTADEELTAYQRAVYIFFTVTIVAAAGLFGLFLLSDAPV